MSLCLMMTVKMKVGIHLRSRLSKQGATLYGFIPNGDSKNKGLYPSLGHEKEIRRQLHMT